MKQKVTFIVFFLILIPSFFNTLFANETKSKPKEITMGFLQPKGHPVMEWLTLQYTEAFSRMGIKMKSKYYPAKRLSVMSNSGLVDG